MRPRVVQPRLERMVRAAQPVDRERRGEIGRAREPLRADQRQRGDGRRRLRAVDQREPFLRLERHRRDAGARERRRAVERRRIGADGRESFADEDERQVGERREVAARADGSAARDHGMDARVERVDQPVERRAADPREPFREDVGAQNHHRPHRARRQRLADAGRMAPQQVALQVAERRLRNLHFRQRAESGVDAVDRCVAGRMAIDNRSSGVDGRRRGRAERHGRQVVGDRRELVEGQAVAVEGDHQMLNVEC
jgi:hypothetical protein